MIAGDGSGSINSRRYSSVNSVFLHGTRKASELFGSLALTHEKKWASLKIAPYLRLDAVQIALNPYTETGSQIWALSFKQMNTQSISGIVGLRSTYDIPMSWGKLTAMGRLQYQSRLEGTYNQQLGYADLAGGTVYTVTAEGLASNEMTAGLGLRATAGPGALTSNTISQAQAAKCRHKQSGGLSS